jgi:hypothetical protein
MIKNEFPIIYIEDRKFDQSIPINDPNIIAYFKTEHIEYIYKY